MAKAKRLGTAKTMTFGHVFTRWSDGKIDDIYLFDKKAIGEGSYGVVTVGTMKETGAKRAIKAIDLGKIANPARFEDEINIQQNLDHPNIAKLYEVYKDYKKVYLVMELCSGGELFDRIVAEADSHDGAFAFGEKDAAVYMKQIMGAMHYLHSQHYVHRDIKPENFLMQHRGRDAEIKVIDFGLSKKYNPEEGPMRTKAGTPFYVAPQVLAGQYDEKCDIWSCGVILYIVLCGYPPFYGDKNQEILRAVKKGKFEFASPDWDETSNEAKDLIKKMLTFDPSRRPNAQTVLDHAWFKIMDMDKAASPNVGQDFCKKLREFRGVTRMKKVALTLIATQMNYDEVSELKATFMAMDENNDGTLTIEEISAAMGKHDLQVPEDIITVIKKMDTDGSGSIDYTEFIAATLTQSQYIKKDILWGAFRMFDKDGNGKITPDELQEMMTGKVDETTAAAQQVADMIKEVDLDGDGKLSFDEFVKMMEGTSAKAVNEITANVQG